MTDKKLYRSGQDKIIAGVCGGIAEYFDVDPVWVRLLTALIILTTGVGLVLYIIAWIIMPVNPAHKNVKDTKAEAVSRKIINKVKKEYKEDNKVHKQYHVDNKSSHRDRHGRFLGGALLIILGAGLLMKNLFYWFNFVYVAPVILIAIGLYLMMVRPNR